MRLDLWKGDAAFARLDSPGFRAQWERLYADCPWASVFQSYGYASTWYAVYRPRFTPLLVGAVGDDGSLRGLLPLAVGADGPLVMAGAHQAEYQVWLARPGDGDAFVEAALERLAVEYRGRTLALHYLPAAAPRAWLASRRGIARRCVVRSVPRGLMDLSEARAEASLTNKRNRYKVKRLERVGPVAYERVTDPVAIASLLDEIAPLCDLRHGALHGVMPFRDDPLKAPFHRALTRVPGLLYVSALRCGSGVACAGFDADNRGQLALGFAGFSPFLSRHSPRRIHLLSLARDLARRGYTSIDLTPGVDDYKTEWATRFEDVYTLSVFFSGTRFALQTTAGAVRRTAKALLRMVGADAERLGEHLGQWTDRFVSAEVRRTPTLAARELRRRLWSDEVVDLYEFSGDAIRALPAGRPMNRDRVRDLVAYRPGVLARESRRAFLHTALRRLEHDAHVLTRVDGGELVACGWVSAAPASDDQTGVLGALRRPADSALVYELMASSPLSTPDELASILAELVREAAALPGVGRVLVMAPRTPPNVRQAAQQLGGRYVGRVARRARVEKTWSRSTVVADDESTSPRPTSTEPDHGERAVVRSGAEVL